MIAMTADPAGDVSQRARSGLVSAVSMNTFAVHPSEIYVEYHKVLYFEQLGCARSS